MRKDSAEVWSVQDSPELGFVDDQPLHAFRAVQIRWLRSLSEMQSEEARNHCDHNDYADDVKNIHCFCSD
jgi:hypothetical protein